jgi:two-component system sensor histidine kinase TctE
VEQLRQQGDAPITDLAPIARAVALDLAPLIAEHRLDFSIDTVPSPIRAHEWALRELVRNLLHNAIKLSPDGSRLRVEVVTDSHHAALTVADSGPGISAQQRKQLFEPFAADAGAAPSLRGSGLGLAICHEIVLSLNGSIVLDNREQQGRVDGLDAIVRLPIERFEAVSIADNSLQ